MQTQTPQAPAPPAPPAPPAIPDVPDLPEIPDVPDIPNIRIQGDEIIVGGLPPGATVAQLEALRGELSDQLISAQGRREELVEQLQALHDRGLTGVEADGLRQRIAQLDERILRIESDIAESGRQLALATANEEPGTSVPTDNPFDLSSGQITGISIVFILFVLAPMALAAARLMFKRASRPPRPPALPPESAQRLERLEHGMDAVAIEIERISEGQRFVTKLLTESRAAQPVAIPQRVADEA